MTFFQPEILFQILFSALLIGFVYAIIAAGLSLILDAMSAGRPAVCSDLPVVREYVVDGVTGILVPPGDIRAMVNALESLLLEPGLCETMGQAARARYEAAHTFSAFARRTYDFLTEVCDASSTGP